MEIKVKKKDGSLQEWLPSKIKEAITQSSYRTKNGLSEEDKDIIVSSVENELLIDDVKVIDVLSLHELVMKVLASVNRDVYLEYRAYRNYKEKFSQSFSNTYKYASKVVVSGDKENANKDSTLNSTKQALISEGTMKEFMTNFELKPEWVKAHKDGYIHIHDIGSRFLNSHNCCLFDMENVLKGGFQLNGIHYAEPGGIQSAFNVASDVVLSASAQQYGGFTVSNIDKILSPYAHKTYDKALMHFLKEGLDINLSKKLARKQVMREIEQGYQAFETKLNTVSNSLGQTPFVTISLGMDISDWGRMISKTILTTRTNGLGTKKTTAVFPKIVFLHRNEICGFEGTPNYDLKKLALECSRKRLYPDWLSIDNGYQAEVYEECGKTVTGMGCRAFLGKFYHPITNELIYEGRANIGAVTLNLPLYALESNGDKDKFYELIDKYSEMVWDIHLYTYKRIGKSKGSTNPLFYCEGGAWKKVGYNDEIAPVLDGFTASLGYIGLEEVIGALFNDRLENHIDFGTEVVKHLLDNVEKAKKKHGKLFTLYATPAESLIERFQKINKEKHGVIKYATDKAYMSNSFHQHVTIKHNPPKKLLLEKPMFDLTAGGRIQYCEFPYNIDDTSLEQVVNFAMKNGSYFGVNIESSTCQDCGEQGEFNICPNCASSNITSVNRCCGYLSFSKVNGDSRYNEGKKAEIVDRVDHI